jgi:hypothetical protein
MEMNQIEMLRNQPLLSLTPQWSFSLCWRGFWAFHFPPGFRFRVKTLKKLKFVCVQNSKGVNSALFFYGDVVGRGRE